MQNAGIEDFDEEFRRSAEERVLQSEPHRNLQILLSLAALGPAAEAIRANFQQTMANSAARPPAAGGRPPGPGGGEVGAGPGGGGPGGDAGLLTSVNDPAGVGAGGAVVTEARRTAQTQRPDLERQ